MEREAQSEGRSDSLATTTKRTLIVVMIVAVALALWQIVDALLLIFVGVLLAVFIRGLARRLARHSPLTTGWALGVVIFALVGVTVGGGYFIGPRIAAEISQLAVTLPDTIDRLKQMLADVPGGPYIIDSIEGPEGNLSFGGDIFSRLTGTASKALSTMTNVLLILFAGLFFSINPSLYAKGLTSLVPKGKEDRVAETLDACGHALWKWLMGKLIAMIFVGVYVSIGLWLISMPVPLGLGSIAGLLDFVPFVGPIVAAVPGVLLGLTVSPAKALYAALIYFTAQQIEGNILTPFVQQEQVSLPPVLVLFAVLAAGLLFGLIGVIVATPLVVVIMVFVKMLYIEDALGKDVQIPGR